MSIIPTATGRRGSTPSPTGTYANREETIERLWTFLAGINVSGFTMATGAANGEILTSDANGSGSWQPLSAITASFQDSLFSIFDNSDTTKIAAFQCSGITTGTTRTFTFPDASSTLAVLGLAQTFTAAQTINPGTDVKPLVVKAHAGETQDWFRVENSAATAFLRVSGGSAPIGTKGEVVVGDGATVLYPIIFRTYSPTYGWGAIYDGTNSVTLLLDAAPAGTALTFPGSGGTVVTTLATQTLQNKELETNSYASTGTSVLAGFHFRDNSTSTKRLYVQTNAGFAGSHVLKIGATTAARTYTLPDGTGTLVELEMTNTWTKRQVFDGESGSKANINLTAITDPGTPSAGDIWNDTTQLRFATYRSTIKEWIPGTLYTKTSTTTVAGTTTPTDMVGTGVGQARISANSSAAGKTIRVTARGYYGTTGTPTLKLHVGINGVSGNELCSTGAQTTGSGLSNRGWELVADITFRTTGASGTVFSQGKATMSTSATAADVWDMETTATVGSLDTTTNLDIYVVAEWGTASASNTISCSNMIIEAMN